MQRLNVELSIDIPEEYILITKVEYEELKEQELHGVYWTMRDLEQRTNRQSKWLKEHILFHPQFRKKLDSENGGFVFYPKSKGHTWAFQATKMTEFLEKNFSRIFKST